MDKEKINAYSLIAGIHTLALRTTGTVNLLSPEPKDIDYIRRWSTDRNGVTTILLNPNKYAGDIYRYSEFREVFDKILSELHIELYKIVRCDMRFDSPDASHYEAYAKLHRYIISLLATAYSVKNSYQTHDLFTNKQCSVAAKNDYFEIENYDKRRESDGRDTACSRLELRNKRIDTDIKAEFLEKWGRRFNTVLKEDNIIACLNKYNDALAMEYRENQQSNQKQFSDLTGFICYSSKRIFTKQQLVALLASLGVDSPEGKADYHRKHYGIEYISEYDLKCAVNKIMENMTSFFES